MKDTIYRQDAIDAFEKELCDVRAFAVGFVGAKRILESVPSAQTEQRWTPCSERLPEEDGGLYLVTDYAKSINRRRMHLSRCYMNKDGFWSDVPIGYKVVAWMPLPEPYSERREE